MKLTNKKKFILLLVAFLFMLLTNLTYAASFTATASSTNIKVGDTVTITVKANNAAGMYKVSSDNTSVLAISSGSASEFLENSSTKIVFKAKKTGTANITATSLDMTDLDNSKVPVKGSKTFKINVTDSSKTSSDNKSTTNNTTNTKKSSNANLKTLGVTPKEYDFSGFNKNKTDYSVTVPSTVDSLKVTAIAEDSKKAKVSISGNSGFEVGSGNKIKVTVTAEDGTTKTYNIKVTKLATEEEKPGNVINEEEKLVLKSLTIDGITLSPEFSSDIYSYTANLEEDLSEVTVNGVASESDAKIEVTGNTNLIDGENVIKVTVTSKDGQSTVTYQITLNKVATDLTKNEEKNDTTLNFGKKAAKIIIITIAAIIILIIIITVLLVGENKRLKNLNEQDLSKDDYNEEIKNLNDIPRTDEDNKKYKRGGKHF